METMPGFNVGSPLDPVRQATDPAGFGSMSNIDLDRTPPRLTTERCPAAEVAPEMPIPHDNFMVSEEEFRPRSEFTDLENAARLAWRYGHKLRYCNAAGGWFAWESSRWARGGDLAVEALAKETVKAMRTEIGAITNLQDRYAAEQRVRQAESRGRIAAMIALARSEPGIAVTPEMLDRDPYLLNCLNGTLDLRTGELRPHDPGDLITRLVPVRYRPDARCPAWSRFLDRVCSQDLQMSRYLQRAAGYALTGDTREQCLFYLFGRGRNGKSVFLNTLREIMGDYGITVPSELLTTRGRDQHPTGLTDLDGRRFVTTIEVEDGSRLAESLVKSLTGGDRIRARRLYCDSYEFAPAFKLFIAANHRFEIIGTDEGIWSRIRLIPFLEVIPEEERDPLLMEKLRAEAEGILAWMVRGCLEWQANGLSEPDVVRQATAEYREESDPIGEFLDAYCIQEPGASVPARDLHDRYLEWCRDNGKEQLGTKRFSKALDERGIPRKKSSSCHRIGLRLRQEG